MLAGLDQPERYPGQVFTKCSQTDRFSLESIVESKRWMVLHRPVELARFTRHVRAFTKPLHFRVLPHGAVVFYQHEASWTQHSCVLHFTPLPAVTLSSSRTDYSIDLRDRSEPSVDTVALLRAEAGSSPSGTGSFNYFTNFTMLVENLAFAKQVQVLGHDVNTNTWGFHSASFGSSVPGNGEVWSAHVGSSPIDQFVVQYQVLGQTFWDNNGGFNYALDTHAAESTDGVGSVALDSNVLVVEQNLDSGGNLTVDVIVRNLAFVKQVGLVFTTNNWASFQNAFGTFRQSFPPFGAPRQINAELWEISSSVGVGQHGQYAVFYGVDGNTFWDNNFNQNYSF